MSLVMTNSVSDAFREILEKLVATTQPYTRLDKLPPPHVLPEHYDQALATLLDVVERVVIGDDDEQNLYRDKKNRLMCSTCGEEAFGGTCDCTWANDIRASQRAALRGEKKE